MSETQIWTKIRQWYAKHGYVEAAAFGFSELRKFGHPEKILQEIERQK